MLICQLGEIKRLGVLGQNQKLSSEPLVLFIASRGGYRVQNRGDLRLLNGIQSLSGAQGEKKQ